MLFEMSGRGQIYCAYAACFIHGEGVWVHILALLNINTSIHFAQIQGDI